MVSLALTETGCAGALGVLTFWVFYPLALLNLFTAVWSLVTGWHPVLSTTRPH